MKSFVQFSWIWLQTNQKTVFRTYFRGLNQNVFPPWISKLHIRNLHESAAEKSVQIRMKSFVQISSSVFYKSCFDYPKIDKFQLISFKIFSEPSKSAFLIMYGDKNTTHILAIVYSFYKKITQIKLGRFVSRASFCYDNPIKN